MIIHVLPTGHIHRGVRGVSLTREPDLNVTVLAHNDLAVGTPGTHEISWGPGHNFKSSTRTNTIGFSGSF